MWLPTSFILPTLSYAKDEYYDRGRSYSEENNVQSEYDFDIHYGPLLSRLDAYFSLLGISEMACRLKLLCQVHQKADEWQPLSNLFSRLFEQSQLMNNNRRPVYYYHENLLKFFRYYWAAKKAMNATDGDCRKLYEQQCPRENLIRTDMLHFWQSLSRRFAIQLEDE